MVCLGFRVCHLGFFLLHFHHFPHISDVSDLGFMNQGFIYAFTVTLFFELRLLSSCLTLRVLPSGDRVPLCLG